MWVFRSMMCVGRGWWNGLYQLCISHSRKKEIQKLVFSLQLTNHTLLVAGAPGFLCLTLALGPTSLIFIEWGKPEHVTKGWIFHGPSRTKGCVFKSTSLSCMHLDFTLWRFQGLLQCVHAALWPWTPEGRSHYSNVLFFISHILPSFACSTGFGEKGIAADNLQVWFIFWMMGGPNWGEGGVLPSSGGERHSNYGKCNKVSREKQSRECREPRLLLWNLSSDLAPWEA